MKSLLVGIAIASTFVAGAAIAQPQGPMGRGGCGGGGCGAQYMRMFDAKTVEQLTGDVVRVSTVAMKGRGMHGGGMGGMKGVHAWVKSGSDEIEVHLGPAWFMDNQDLKLAKGDRVDVRGSRVTIEGKPAIIAIEARRGTDVLKLRDESGVPVWVAWRAGPKS